MKPLCFDGPDAPESDPCSENAGCFAIGEEPRYLQATHTRTVTGPGEATTWDIISSPLCLPLPEGEEGGDGPTPADVLTEFRRLSWPQASLTVQPPGGHTLINKPTYAHTTDTATITKDVTLLGQDITIEATPSSWTWHWGDGAADTTSHPGGPYPDGTVTHVYRRAGVTVNVRVDVTYSGRYRVNGGAWQSLDGTHTVRGEAESLQVHQAVPQLVH